MKIGKRMLLYLVTLMCVLFVGFLFIKFFTFDNKMKYISVTEEDVMKVYSLIPDYYTYSTTFYSNLNYLDANNLSNDGITQMVYKYIEKNDQFKFESVSDTDKNKFDDIEVIYKINKKYFESMVNNLFLSSNYSLNKDIKVDIDKSIRNVDTDEYLYIYKSNNEIKDNIKTYNGLYSYTLEDSNNILIITEYYLKCDIDEKRCFNNEAMSSNGNLSYSDNIDINNNKEKLIKYEHKFQYVDGYFKYQSTSK